MTVKTLTVFIEDKTRRDLQDLVAHLADLIAKRLMLSRKIERGANWALVFASCLAMFQTLTTHDKVPFITFSVIFGAYLLYRAYLLIFRRGILQSLPDRMFTKYLKGLPKDEIPYYQMLYRHGGIENIEHLYIIEDLCYVQDPETNELQHEPFFQMIEEGVKAVPDADTVLFSINRNEAGEWVAQWGIQKATNTEERINTTNE